MNESCINYFMFIKISVEPFIDSLQKKGHFYCNPITYFRSIENDNLKKDKNEGKAFIKQVKNLQIQIKGKTIATSPQAQFYFDHPEDSGNIYCLYGVKTELVDLTKKSLQKVKIEDISSDFGKCALLITQPEEFLKRITKELNRQNRNFDFSPVHYYDHNSYEGELSPFYKSNNYSHQSEVRLWVPNKEEKPFEFFVGDISDISHKVEVSDLNKIEVEVK